MPRKIKAIIFDCFGVIYPIASVELYNLDKVENGNKLLDELNRQIDLGEISSETFHKRIEERVGVPAEKLKEKKNKYMIPSRELVELIKQLKRKYKIGLLSNTGDGELDVLDRDGIKSLFDVITASYIVKILKPDQRIYLKCAEEIGVNPRECLFIDDNQDNIEGARKTGMETIQYKNLSQLKNDLKVILN
ncbi:MAG: HAD family phosphatase [Candidatus Levybacteria bacterium]|nr:HAD family phosphatase [Candidatus Levybacteria bacterium]